MISEKERIPLKEGMELELRAVDSKGNYYIQQAVIEAYIGSGATCLSYIVKINRDGSNYARMVMKEFYPSGDRFVIERRADQLKISDETKRDRCFLEEQKNFRNSFVLQNHLAGSEAMEIMVKPYLMAEYGDSLYLLSEMHLGEVLSFSTISGLSDKFWLIYRTAEAVSLLHEQGYLYMDLNPKNILWIPSQKAVKLFDVDSIIPYREPDQVTEIRVTKEYAAPELKELEKWLEATRHAFLKPSWDVYGLGLLLFEQLFDRLPDQEDLKTGYGKPEELEEICWRAGCRDLQIIEKLKEILYRSLNCSFRIRYGSARSFCEEVNELKKRLDAQPFIPKKEYAKANEKISAYYLLDQHPLYDFSYHENGKCILDVAVIGSHSIRKELIKAIYACAHMINSVLRIRLYGEDSQRFLDELRKENPALEKTIRIFSGDDCIWERWDPVVCAQPVAEFFLYQQLEEVEKLPSPYVLVLEENREICRRILSLLPERTDEKQRFLAGMENMADMPEFDALIPLRSKCSGYDEEFIRTEFLQRAMNVHGVYSRDMNKRITRKEIRESFRADIYNMESSMRSALAVKYKLASAGIDPLDRNMEKKFCSRVLSHSPQARDLLDQLSDLEHISWSAHLIITGWDLPDSAEIEGYAFENGNDFKEREKKLHPCIRESRPGNRLVGLKREDWESEEMCRNDFLDGLEQATVFMHQIAGKKAGAAKENIRGLVDRLNQRMRHLVSWNVLEALAAAEMVLEQIFQGKSGGKDLWKNAREEFLNCCRENGVYFPWIADSMREIEEKLKVVFEYFSFRDYKRPDEVIIRKIPSILTDGKIRTMEVTWDGQKSNRWKNVLPALYFEPDHLVLLSQQKRNVDVKFYQDFLENCGRETDVSVKTVKIEPGSFGQPDSCGIIGPDSIFTPDEMEKIYGRELCLTVKEALALHGTDMMQQKTAQAVYPPVSVLENIWDVYREHTDGWSLLTKILRDEDKKNIFPLPEAAETVSGAEEWKEYTTDYIYGNALNVTGADFVMRRLLELGHIKIFQLPGEGEEIPVVFASASKETAELLTEILETANREPFRHHYFLEKSDTAVQGKEKNPILSIRDKTNYVCDRISVKKRTFQGQRAAKLLSGYLKELWENGTGQGGRQRIIQNLKLQESEETLTFSFKYATAVVKACLTDEYRTAEIMLYYACRNMNCFDDFGTISELIDCVCKSGYFSELTGKEKNGILAVKGRKLYCFVLRKKEKRKDAYTELKASVSCFGENGIWEKQISIPDKEMNMEKLEHCMGEIMQDLESAM